MILDTLTLLTVTSQTTTQTGTSYLLAYRDPSPDMANSRARLFGTITQSGGATSPLGTLTIETSDNGTNWVSISSGDWVTNADETVHIDGDEVVLMKYVRAKLTPSGGTAPTLSCRIVLAISQPFSSTAQA
jgi:hypothetical protein